jgi:hypothetical protein
MLWKVCEGHFFKEIDLNRIVKLLKDRFGVISKQTLSKIRVKSTTVTNWGAWKKFQPLVFDPRWHSPVARLPIAPMIAAYAWPPLPAVPWSCCSPSLCRCLRRRRCSRLLLFLWRSVFAGISASGGADRRPMQAHIRFRDCAACRAGWSLRRKRQAAEPGANRHLCFCKVRP